MRCGRRSREDYEKQNGQKTRQKSEGSRTVGKGAKETPKRNGVGNGRTVTSRGKTRGNREAHVKADREQKKGQGLRSVQTTNRTSDLCI